MRIAERTGCSLQRVKAETTVREFFLWQARFEEEVNERKPENWYQASIAFEIFETAFRIWGKSSGRSLEDFLLKFDVGDAATPGKGRELTEEEKKTKLAISKSYWKSLKEGAEEAKKRALEERAQQEKVRKRLQDRMKQGGPTAPPPPKKAPNNGRGAGGRPPGR